jgi:hypothetical protein
MSRVDFIVDGDTEAQAHQYEHDDVRISLDGGNTFISPEEWMHVVIEVDTEAPEDAELHVNEDAELPEDIDGS